MRTDRIAAAIVAAVILGACGSAAPTTTAPGTPTTTTAGATSTSTSAPTPDPTVAPTTAPAPTTTVSVTGCAAAGLPSEPVDQDLPEPVATTRAAIVAAAVSCDVEALAALAVPGFTYSFGGGDDPAGFWTDLETRSATEGEISPLSMLVRLLDLPHGTIDAGGTIYYVWPSAHAYDGGWESVPQNDRDALLGVYGAQDLADFATFGGYIGYRVGITADGRWMYFVAGD